MLLCRECKNEEDFYERTVVEFVIDAEGNREEKMREETTYICMNCHKEVFMFMGD